jgi:hypothetical protein
MEIQGQRIYIEGGEIIYIYILGKLEGRDQVWIFRCRWEFN